ncbi:MAG: alkaline phosphatase family protein [Okeania sp. SIO2G4]|uniref:alkaline phosphatase D family protein n=1 Tax=unclassified Okeania TaxID=2634635 RepID=UPI0013BC715B|nr:MULTISPECIES: alkaline phosphatase D family protein [unclassified Okeania]NEP73672.1 alkaline phosphatase family protein [Okeania sp. SIO2G5]NEP94378.1 alkaline phosphatase family protein [Okeania sp. SIO2F5]NEQ92232.1 alkaline phosphatase family protein [Okeania sp. SIO2G4]
MKVKPLTVGPILGAVTGDTARIFGRGEYKLSSNKKSVLPCVGVARIRALDSSDYDPPIFFKMSPAFDTSGVAVFDELSSETEYEYQIGYFLQKKEEVDQANINLDWSKAHTKQFQTASTDPKKSRSFIFGSCRYLLKLFGSWFDDRGDKTFESILKQINSGTTTNSLLMVGDQIYADDLNAIGADRTIEEFFSRYQETFTQPHIRELMGQIPTYMTLDDHEIEDNWPSKASPKDWVTLFPVAIHAYITYQMSHSPLFEIVDDKADVIGSPSKLWYKFTDGCCDFFVTDTRTERDEAESCDPAFEEREIINEDQFEALKKWLADGSERVKFVASAVPFFPDFKKTELDKWSGYLHQRTELLEFIRTNKIKRVVFLSGDVHCSMSAELLCEEDPDFKIISLISSAFFWPYPHKSGSFQLSGKLKTTSLTSHSYTVTNAGPAHFDDNFSRVTCDLNSLKFQVFQRLGKLLGEKEHSF